MTVLVKYNVVASATLVTVVTNKENCSPILNYREEDVAPVGHLQICAAFEYMGAALEILTISIHEGICGKQPHIKWGRHMGIYGGSPFARGLLIF